MRAVSIDESVNHFMWNIKTKFNKCIMDMKKTKVLDTGESSASRGDQKTQASSNRNDSKRSSVHFKL